MISSRPINLAKVLKSTASQARSLESKLPDHVPGEILVHVGDDCDVATLADDYQAALLERVRLPEGMGGEMLRLKLGAGIRTAQGIVALDQDSRISMAASNDIIRPVGQRRPNDLKEVLWGLHNTGEAESHRDSDIDAPEAWTLTTGSRNGPVVAVLDTGVDYTHPELDANIWVNKNETPNGEDSDGNGVVDDIHGYNAMNGSGDPMDDGSHGTHVAGTVAAEGDNGEGIVGVNWEAQVMPLKFLGANGGTLADAVKGISYGEREGARIFNHSWGGGGYNPLLENLLRSSKALHVIAAGNETNDNDKKPTYPASYTADNIISVAATDSRDELGSFSNWGATSVDLAAPGVGVESTLPNNSYGSYNGTSMAAPHVTGVAALIATRYPEASNAEIKERILNGTDPIPGLTGKVLSGGRLNAYNALDDDKVPPAAPKRFRADTGRTGKLEFQWTAPGDDGMSGQASRYEMRVSDRPINNEEDFKLARPVETGRPRAAGQADKLLMEVVPSAKKRKLHAAIRAIDNVHQISPLSSTSVEIPASQVAFEDNGSDHDWTPTATWGRVTLADGNEVWKDSPLGDYGPGLSAPLTSGSISLAGVENSTLAFEASHDIEPFYDRLAVEVRPQDGSWKRLGHFDGRGESKVYKYDLSPYDGTDIQVRFAMESDASGSADGVTLDNIVIYGESESS